MSSDNTTTQNTTQPSKAWQNNSTNGTNKPPLVGTGEVGEDDLDDCESVFSMDAEAMAALGERALGELGATVASWRDGALADVDGSDVDTEVGTVDGRSVVEQDTRPAEMRELVASWQEAARGVVLSALRRGYFPPVSPDRQPEVAEKVFACGKLYSLISLEDTGGLYADLRAGRVVANVVGATGLGKSTKFAAMVASKCGMRVLQISPDTALRKDHAAALSKIVRARDMWPTVKGAALVVTTPQQFCGHFFGDGWGRMMDCFDVVIVDEAHIPDQWMYGIRAAFSSKEFSTSLLMLTATIPGQSDLQSSTYKPEYLPKKLQDLVEDPFFLDKPYARDRTMYIVESDDRLREVADKLYDQGVEVIALESCASEAMIEEARRRLLPDATTVRILLAHNRFDVGYTFPVSGVVTTGLRRVLKEVDGVFSWGAVPLTQPEIKQQLARAGRMGHGVGCALVLLPENVISPPTKLVKNFEFDAYVLLVAMGIRPGARLQKAVAKELPFGLERRVAVGLLQYPTLPVRVLIRFLAADGRFPRSIYKALRNFGTSEDTSSLISSFDEPVAYSSWTPYSTFSPLGETSEPYTLLPVKCDGELCTQLIFVCAAAEKKYVPEPIPRSYDDGYDSGPEASRVNISGVARARHRGALLIVDTETEKDVLPEYAYAFDVPRADQAAYRRGGLVVPPVVTEHLSGDGFTVGIPEVVHYVDRAGKRKVKLVFPDSSPIPLHSPGGSQVFTFAARLWTELVKGGALSLVHFKALLSAVGTDVQAFSDSSAFAKWGPVWLSVLRSLALDENVQYLQKKAMVPYATSLVAMLWDRYNRGLHEAVAVSHTAVGFWRRLVSNYDKIVSDRSRAARNGRVPIAQSDEFKSRLFEIREAFAEVMVAFESNGYYDPGGMAKLQRVLPVSRGVGHSVVDVLQNGRGVAADVGSSRQLSRLAARFG